MNTLFAQDLMYFDQSAGASPHLFIQSGADVYVQGGVIINNTVASGGLDGGGNLYIIDQNSVQVAGNNATNATANWTDNASGLGISTGGTSLGTVYIYGGNNQTITGNSSFYNLYTDNLNGPAASVNGITVAANSDFVVRNVWTINRGMIHLAANANPLISNASAAAVIPGPNNIPASGRYKNAWIEAMWSTNASLDRQIANSASTYEWPIGPVQRLQLLELVPTNSNGITRLSGSWETGVVGNTPLSTLYECPNAGQPYNQVHPYGEWHLRPNNGGAMGTGTLGAGGFLTINGHFNIPSGGFVAPALADNYFALLFRQNGSVAPAGWQKAVPGCSSLPPIGSPGRIVASDYAARNSMTSYSDNTSQIGVGTTIWPLPIELLSFTGWNEGAVNQLAWTTATEFNTDYFDVQRSPSGADYAGIGQVAAAGFSSEPTNYSFTDFKPFIGHNFYRLKMVDNDNSFIYSNIVVIDLANALSQIITIYPNPTMGNLNLQIHEGDDEDVLITITDELGRTVKSVERNVIPGNNIFEIDTKDLSGAAYFLTVRSLKEGESNTLKFIKAN